MAADGEDRPRPGGRCAPVRARRDGRMQPVADFVVAAGAAAGFRAELWPLAPAGARADRRRAALVQTQQYWRDWISRFRRRARRSGRRIVKRSLITLKAMAHRADGAAWWRPRPRRCRKRRAGRLNWDYRYCWLRDATSRLAPCRMLASTTKPRRGGTGCCGRSPGRPNRCGSCIGSTVRGTSTNGRSRALPGYRYAARCASAMPHRPSIRSTCSARFWTASASRGAAGLEVDRAGDGRGRGSSTISRRSGTRRVRGLGIALRTPALHLFQGHGMGRCRSRVSATGRRGSLPAEREPARQPCARRSTTRFAAKAGTQGSARSRRSTAAR